MSIIFLRDLGMRYPTVKSKKKVRYGIFRCSCGKEFKTQTSMANRLLVKSCGCAKKSLLYGVGINDANYKIENKIDGKRVECPFYRRWKDMIKRAYSIENHKQQPTYKDVTVCKEWHLFSNFKKWMEAQDWQGKELDKDILYPDNKIYSPKTCCFVIKELNLLLAYSGKSRGKYPKGVCFRKDRGVFQSIISINNRNKTLGAFNAPHEAYQAYLVAKTEHIKTFFTLVDNRIKKGLQKHIALLENHIAK